MPDEPKKRLNLDDAWKEARDPLAGMRMTTAGLGALTSMLLAAADALCEGRIVFVTEGGYDTRALHDCVQKVIALASV